MAGSARWLRDSVYGRRCEVCGERFTEYAIRELRCELLVNEDGPGYGAIKTTAVAHCPTCGNSWDFVADGVNEADMKHGIGWLVARTRQCINPFTGKVVEFPEILSDASDICACDPSDESEDDAGEAGDADDDDAEPGCTDQKEPDPQHPNRGRRLAVPSIRSCCPPSPITDGTLKSARRVLRCYSDIRTAPSFARLMKRFGVSIDANSNNN